MVNSKLRKQNNSPKTTTIQTQQQVDPNIEMLVSLLEEQELQNMKQTTQDNKMFTITTNAETLYEF